VGWIRLRLNEGLQPELQRSGSCPATPRAVSSLNEGLQPELQRLISFHRSCVGLPSLNEGLQPELQRCNFDIYGDEIVNRPQ